jgi:hypothetical protein
MKLIELPNGDWIAPDSIKAIRKGDRARNDHGGPHFAPRVIIEFGARGWIVLNCKDDAERDTLAAGLASQVNDARDPQ